MEEDINAGHELVIEILDKRIAALVESQNSWKARVSMAQNEVLKHEGAIAELQAIKQSIEALGSNGDN